EDTYDVYRNESIILNSLTWTNGSDIFINIDGLRKGLYNFTIIVFDKSGNSAVDTVWITVNDNTNPVFTSPIPTDFSYNEGDTPNIITWNVTDLYEDNYIIYRNGSQVDSGSWTNATTISYNTDIPVGLLKGAYNFTIIVFDISGNNATHTIWLTVFDSNDPLIVEIPIDYSYDEGIAGNTITWNTTDTHPTIYAIYNLTGIVDSGSWTNGDEIIYSVDGLSKGIHNFTLFVYDNSGNSANHTVTITVTDGTLPGFASSPSDILYTEGVVGNSLSWTPTDAYPGTYFIYRNDTEIDSGPWISENPIIINVDGLYKGSYNFTIIIYDASGNPKTDIAWVTVSDDTDPEITGHTSPIGDTYIEGTTGHSIVWTANDRYNDTYIIYNNSIPFVSGSWATGIIPVSIDGLTIGEYSFTIFINDTSGNFAFDTVVITVNEITPPSPSSPSDIVYSEGSIGNFINWTVSDTYPGTYQITRNGLVVDLGIWSNGINISLNIDGLIVGTYNFTLYVDDTTGNFDYDWVEVIVIDATDPVRISPGTQVSYTTIEAGTVNPSINWTITDRNPNNYYIYYNGTPIFNRGWNDNEVVIYPIQDILDKLGVYNFTIIVEDDSGNSITLTIMVMYEDNIKPQFADPLAVANQAVNTTFAEGDNTQSLKWDVNDATAGDYVLYTNGTPSIPLSWSPEVDISVPLFGLTKGAYNYTIFIFDEAGNSINSTVIFTVTDKQNPIITDTLDIPDYVEGDTGNTITWTITDNYPSFYNLTLDGVVQNISSWFSSQSITINIDGLSTGEYNYTIKAFDQSGNYIVDSVIVTVNDETHPTFNSVPDLSGYIEGTTGNELIWNIFDVHPADYNLTRNGEVVKYTNWTSGLDIIIDIDGLEAGTYNFSIYVIDLSENNLTHWIVIEVLDIEFPTINSRSI
ncbi:MAG: hypothetical protein ACW99A_22320, partial [Candidatus Kariarchaeaceae archaeon]